MRDKAADVRVGDVLIDKHNGEHRKLVIGLKEEVRNGMRFIELEVRNLSLGAALETVTLYDSTPMRVFYYDVWEGS